MKRLLYILCASIVGTAFADNENFDGLDKSGADFSGASLKNSSWVGTTVSDATFTNADISGATFDSTTGFTANQLYSTKNYATDNTLENLTLSNLGELGYLDLSGKTLNDVGIKNNKHSEGKVGINLTNAKLNNVNFSGTEINVSGGRRNYAYGINLTGATVKNLILSNSKIEANYGYAIYIDTNVDGLDLSNAKLSDKYGSRFKNIVQNSNFDGAIFESDNDGQTVSFSDIKDSTFKGTCFSSTNSNGKKIGAYFGGTLENIDFTDATIAGSSFGRKTNVSLEMLKQTADYKSGIFDSITIYGSLDGFNIAGMKFINGSLYDVSNSDFSNADLSGTTFRGALSNVNFTNATIAGANFDSSQSFSMEILKQTADYKRGVLDSIRIYSSLDGFNIAGMKFINGSLYNVSNSDLSNTDLSGTTFNGVLSSVNFTGSNFNGTSCFKKKITDCDFSNAVFVSESSNTEFRDEISSSNFSNAVFKGTFGALFESNLTDVDFTGSTISNSTFEGSLTNVVFENAKIDGCKFKAANAFTSDMLKQTADYKNITPIRQLYINSDIGNVDFTGRTFTGDSYAFSVSGLKDGIFSDTSFSTTSDLRSSYGQEATLVVRGEISNCDFKNSVFSSQSYSLLAKGDVTNTTFENATINGYLDMQKNVSGCNFSNAKLGEFSIGNVSDSDFVGTKFSGHGKIDSMINSNATGTSFDETQIKNIENCSFKNAKFYTNSSGAATTSFALNTGNIKNSDFSGISVVNATEGRKGLFDPDGIEWRGYAAAFDSATIENVDFSNSSFECYDVSGTGKYRTAAASFMDASLKNVNLSNCKFICNLRSEGVVYAAYATSRALDFRNATLENVDLSNCIITSSVYYDQKGCDEALAIGIDFSGATLYNVNFEGLQFSLSSGGKGVMSTWYGESKWYDGKVVPILMENTTFRGVSFANSNITNKYIESTANYKTKDMSDFDLSGTSLAEIDLSGQNLTNSKFRNADLSKANLEGANLTKVDLRGADLTDVSGEYTLKNTIMADGVIRNFSMTSAEDSAVIVKHTNKTASLSRTARGFSTYNGISAKISEADAVISGGAKLTIDDGALLEVVDGKSLSVDDGGALEFNIGEDYTGAMLSLESGTSFVLDGGEIIINLSNLFVESGVYTFELIDALYGSFIGGDSLIKDGNIKLFVDGQAYSGEWSFVADASGLSVSVPEPSTYAAVFGALALAFVIYRKRR